MPNSSSSLTSNIPIWTTSKCLPTKFLKPNKFKPMEKPRYSPQIRLKTLFCSLFCCFILLFLIKTFRSVLSKFYSLHYCSLLSKNFVNKYFSIFIRTRDAILVQSCSSPSISHIDILISLLVLVSLINYNTPQALCKQIPRYFLALGGG